MEMRDELIDTRELVAETINHHLAINGHESRVDHRTFKERGVRRNAERYLGPARIREMSEEEKATFLSARLQKPS